MGLFGSMPAESAHERSSIYFFNKIIKLDNVYLLSFGSEADGSVSINFTMNNEIRKNGNFTSITFVKNGPNVRKGFSQLASFSKKITEHDECEYVVLTAHMEDSVTSIVFNEKDELNYIQVYGDSLKYYKDLMNSICSQKKQ